MLGLDSQIIAFLVKALVVSILIFFFIINVMVTNQVIRIDQNIKTSFGPAIVIASIVGTTGILILMFIIAFA
jgi:hypothetical protein